MTAHISIITLAPTLEGILTANIAGIFRGKERLVEPIWHLSTELHVRQLQFFLSLGIRPCTRHLMVPSVNQLLLDHDSARDDTVCLILVEGIKVTVLPMCHIAGHHNGSRMFCLGIIDVTSHVVVVVLLESDDDRNASVELGINPGTRKVEQTAEIRGTAVFNCKGLRTQMPYLVALPSIIVHNPLLRAVPKIGIDQMRLVINHRLRQFLIAVSLQKAPEFRIPYQSLVIDIVGMSAIISKIDVHVGNTVIVEISLTDRSHGIGCGFHRHTAKFDSELVNEFIAYVGPHFHMGQLTLGILHLRALERKVIPLVLPDSLSLSTHGH